MILRWTNAALKRFHSSIRTKLVITFTLLIAMVSAFIVVYFPMKLEQQSLQSIATKARSIAGMTSFSISSALYFDDVTTIEEAFASARQNDDVLYLIVLDSTGRTVATFDGQAAIKANYLDTESNQHISVDGNIYRDATPIILNGKKIGSLYLGLSLAELKNEIAQSRAAVAGISLLIFMLGMAIVIWLSTVITKPLSQIAHTAVQVAKGDLTQRANVSTIDEVGDLAASFNHMIENVEDRTRKLQSEIEQREKAETVIREQAALLNVTKDAILVCDLDYRIMFWNKGAEQLYGWTDKEVIGKDIPSLFHSQENGTLAEARKHLLENGEWKGEIQYVNKPGAAIIVESRWAFVRDPDGNPKSVLITDTDVTEKKKLETQFLRAQRMQSVGTLAGGIAHDLNNVLAPILLSVELLKTHLTDARDQRLLSTLETSASRGAGIIKQILSFARGFEGEKTTIQVKHLLKEFERMIKDTFPRSIEIRTRSVKEAWMVSGDPTQLYQVLMNLCVNARDAMPNGGMLKIDLENVVVDDCYARLHLDTKPGTYVALTVTDTGTGMTPDMIDKIFEPFFTTKEVGKGTGLGLSTVIAIIKGHSGFVNVYSEMGKGTRFKVYLPALETKETQQASESNPELPRGEGKLVLVVDDEVAICEMQKATLEAYGYRVLTANDGTEAVSIVARQDGEINAVITDMMMPFLDGASTIRALRKINPRLKFIAVSGLMGDNKTSGLALDASVTFLQKPYTSAKLLLTLNNIFNN